MAHGSSFTGDSSINNLSEDITTVPILPDDSEEMDIKTIVGAIQEDMKRVDLAETAVGGTSKRTIFQVSSHWRREWFRPQIVSIGPYARDNDGGHINKELLCMEVVKKQFLNDLIRTTSWTTSDAFLTACVQKLRELESAIRSCYYKSFDGMRSDVFTKMMLLDGVFIIQYFMGWKRGSIRSTIDVHWNFGTIKHDLLLLENQIPFFVLQALFDLFVSRGIVRCTCTCNNSGSNERHQLLDELLGGFKRQCDLLTVDDKTIINPDVEIKHLLHLYHLWYTSKQNEPSPESTAGSPRYNSCIKIRERAREPLKQPASILSATKLREAGVTVKKKKRPISSLEVTFDDRTGDLEIPPFPVDAMMISKFANLISLENSSEDLPLVVTSHLALLDKIIQTPKDVEILRSEGILEYVLEDAEIALFFNQLCKYAQLYVVIEDLLDLLGNIDAYTKIRWSWHRQRAWFVRNYFSNIWVFTSLVGGVILMVLTLLQAYFSIFAYFRPPSAS